jgi:hypothetical protein
MTASVMSVPRFRKGQNVRFAGGEGTSKSYKAEAGTWAYQIEMARELEPDFGRVGYETTVVLLEAELEPLTNDRFNYLAIA